MVTLEEVRAVAGALPRSSEHLIREYVKFEDSPLRASWWDLD